MMQALDDSDFDARMTRLAEKQQQVRASFTTGYFSQAAIAQRYGLQDQPGELTTFDPVQCMVAVLNVYWFSCLQNLGDNTQDWVRVAQLLQEAIAVLTVAHLEEGCEIC